MASVPTKSCVSTKCSPDTSSKQIDLHTKRSHGGSETDTPSDNRTENIKKRRGNRTDSDNSDGISTECHQCSISKNTSEWTLQCLSNFHIETDISVPSNELMGAYEVFTNGYLYFINNKNKCANVVSNFGSRSEEDEQKCDCYKYAVHDVFNIDCHHIDEVTDEDLHDLKQIETDLWIDNFVERITSTKQRNARERICRDLSRHLNMFKRQLIYMLRRRRGNDLREISEGMYQELFVSFARIFGLNILSGSNVEKYTSHINDRDIVALPNGLICHPTDVNEDKICAVIKVKGYREDEGNDYVSDLRSTNNACYAQHIGSSLKGQLGGQFLCTLPFSVFGNHGMYGFLVQGTNVMLTSFKPEDGYYTNLCNGNLQNKGAVMTYSKEYNLLRKEDRRQLVQTFLDMGKLLEYF
ncbi:uncharacterized protein LOC127704671 [Mytilus californianus]|uniref:uncharacterized protein LOC127704671 n=1 Tax=Mytilus californianus TaxID=6549 RepID=UPI002247EF84|nr:uncharacterized protein LOC127704671 [Mytilus californianus]